MKVALTVWEGRVSPLFDAARELLVADIDDRGVIKNRRHEPMTPQWPSRVVERLIEQDVTVLICGAISEAPAGMIEAAGIRLIAFVAGAVEDVLGMLAKGCPIVPAFSMPGCGCPKCPRPGGMKKVKRAGIPGGGKLPQRGPGNRSGRPVRNAPNEGAAVLKVAERRKGEG
jgi:predicted Fe-Mo cluster-binding NifX family protein